MHILVRDGLANRDYIARKTLGFEKSLVAAKEYKIITGLDPFAPEQIETNRAPRSCVARRL